MDSPDRNSEIEQKNSPDRNRVIEPATNADSQGCLKRKSIKVTGFLVCQVVSSQLDINLKFVVLECSSQKGRCSVMCCSVMFVNNCDCLLFLVTNWFCINMPCTCPEIMFGSVRTLHGLAPPPLFSYILIVVVFFFSIVLLLHVMWLNYVCALTHRNTCSHLAKFDVWTYTA